ncbi:MAG TPA: hypothetical protein VNY84_12490 [Acidimicrobiales bacterium]|nr:hypothetical protein [Acidimicrobiales bacterium]
MALSLLCSGEMVIGAATPAFAAGIALVQKSATDASGTLGSVTPTLPAATAAGHLLVAVLANRANCALFSGPAGWVKAVTNCTASGTTEIWYLANSSAGTTSAKFTWTTGTTGTGELSEWSGVATASPLDKTGTVTVATAATTATVTTTGNVAITGELGITDFVTATGETSQTAGPSWTHLYTDTTRGTVGDQRIGVPAGSLSETETVAPTATTWVGVIATFKTAICNGGSLTLTPPVSVTFPTTTLNGHDLTATASPALTADDETGSGSGWNVQGTSTTFTSGGHTLATSASTVTAGSAVAGSNNCSLPTNAIAYPLTVPAAGVAPTPVKLYNASALTGEGPSTVTLTVTLGVPASTFAGTYSSTWTLTIASGP